MQQIFKVRVFLLDFDLLFVWIAADATALVWPANWNWPARKMRQGILSFAKRKAKVGGLKSEIEISCFSLSQSLSLWPRGKAKAKVATSSQVHV